MLLVGTASVATVVLTDCQANGPTLAVMSSPPAEGGSLVVENLSLGEAVPGRRRLPRNRTDHDLVNMLVHVNRGGRAAYAMRSGRYLGYPDRAGSADLRE